MAAACTPESITAVQGARVTADDPSFAQRSSLPGSIGIDFDEITSGSPQPWPLSSRQHPSPGPPRHPLKTPEGDSRPLQPGEISMASSIFGSAIDYRRARVHNGEYLPFGLQPDDTAMTPNGEMYFNPKHFKEDFSQSIFRDMHWFMHEMVHVWQYQLGYPVKWRGAIRIGLGYEHTLAANKRLHDYNMEAQGNLLSDYWAVSQFTNPPVLWEPKHRNDLALYRAVLAGFIADPSDKKNLPG
jgi:hypothetical protein